LKTAPQTKPLPDSGAALSFQALFEVYRGSQSRGYQRSIFVKKPKNQRFFIFTPLSALFLPNQGNL
jgi:hypothetical protein